MIKLFFNSKMSSTSVVYYFNFYFSSKRESKLCVYSPYSLRFLLSVQLYGTCIFLPFQS